MLILHHRNILSVVSIGSFKDYKLTFATKTLAVPLIPSQEHFPCDVLKKLHSAAGWKLDIYGGKD